MSKATFALVVAPDALAELTRLVFRHLALETRLTTSVAAGRAMLVEAPCLVAIDVSLAGAMELIPAAAEVAGTIAFVDLDAGASSMIAFTAGADQVLRLPFTPDELAVRAGALLRRLGKPAGFAHNEHLDGLLLSLDERIGQGATAVRITPLMNSLLYLLAGNLDRTVTRDEMRRLVWGLDRPATDLALDEAAQALDRIVVSSGAHLTVEARSAGARLVPSAQK